MTRTITVHGYNSDPSSRDIRERPDKQQADFKIMLGPDTEPFNWFSGIMAKRKHMFKAWCSGHLTTYGWAYSKLAPIAASKLRERCIRSKTPVYSIFCHSLGSRVVLLALDCPFTFSDRICFINAAETREAAFSVISRLPSNYTVLNVCVRSDSVLDKAAGWGTPGFGKKKIFGQDGLTKEQISSLKCNYKQVFLDREFSKLHLKAILQTDVEGDNPKDSGDHHYSYKNLDNWPLYRKFFAGQLDDFDLVFTYSINDRS